MKHAVTATACAALFSITAVGCTPGATNSPTTAERRAAASVRLIDGPAPKGARVVKEVEVLLCPPRGASGIDQAAASGPLKLEAARAGANAVVNVLCSPAGTSWSQNCFNSSRCVGDAVILAEK